MRKEPEYIEELRRAIRGRVLNDAHSLGMYATDASIYQITPLVVVLPRDESDVKSALEIAARHRLPVLPRGGGTSLAGQTVGRCMILDFSRFMNRILEFKPEERWVRVQPGIVLDELNRELRPSGLHFAPDPATSSRANIGGMVGNNSSGTKSILYGKTVDHVLEARVLLADGTALTLGEMSPDQWREIAAKEDREGEIYRDFEKLIDENRQEILERFPKVMRRVGGYNLDEFAGSDRWNLARLITGSEGTLAVTLDVKLNLEPLPKFKSVVVAHFAELGEAIRAVEPMLEFRPAAVEILDRTILRLSRENLTTRRHCHFIEGDPAAILITEFYGDHYEEVLERPRRMIRKLEGMGLGYAWPLFPEGETYEDVWITRKKGLGLMLGVKGEKKPLPFIEDACVPVEVLPDYIGEVLRVCRKHETDVSMYAHASVGVIHVRPILDLRLQQDIDRLVAIAGETFDLVMKYEGSWSGEHGDGLVRSSFNERFFGPKLYEAFRRVKRLFDPDNRMNPGKIVDAGPIDRNLRYGAGYRDRSVETVFHYRRENSFRESVHMCTGVGECRKISGGTMCPSFKATLEEEHSTRGRANALRLAMSGQLGDEGLSGKRLHEVLDLCISCKACKSECPSNVDMAKMKSDVLQIYYDEHGTMLRDRMIRDSARASALFSGSGARVVNAVQGSVPFRYLLERATGIDRRRTLPSYAAQTFMQWMDSRPGDVSEHSVNGIRAATEQAERGSARVVLFVDTFMNYHEPQIGRAALELLRSCGYSAEAVAPGCCQRPKISHGFLRKAKTDAAPMLETLRGYLEKGMQVLFVEPGCASALTDDLPDLIDDPLLAGRLKAQVKMLDRFLADEIAEGRLPGRFHSRFEEVWIHGHCHRKALYGMESLRKLFKAAGCRSREIPSGCCGMAGSFGYEKEHYEISKAIGEESLFPAVREMPEQAALVAGGFSCRHQIGHFTGRSPRHWVELLSYSPVPGTANRKQSDVRE